MFLDIAVGILLLTVAGFFIVAIGRILYVASKS